MSQNADALSPARVSEIASFIIRPPRAFYTQHNLGEPLFTLHGTPCRRDDVVIRSPRDQLRLQASYYRPCLPTSPATPISGLPVVVYLHGNSGCRIEANTLLSTFLPYGVAVFSFDFSGSGLSDGRYISLGVFEKLDVLAAVQYLRDRYDVKSIILWGHSMGAATALMYSSLLDNVVVKGFVLDSSFVSFNKLAESMVGEMPVPLGLPKKIVLSLGVKTVRKYVKERADFDVLDINPIGAILENTAACARVPALFVHGTNDEIVPDSHGKALYDCYPCREKFFLPLPNFQHDSPRPQQCMDYAFEFIMNILQADDDREFERNAPRPRPPKRSGDDNDDLDDDEDDEDDDESQRTTIRLNQWMYRLNCIKNKGNDALLNGRFTDAIFLYGRALIKLINYGNSTAVFNMKDDAYNMNSVTNDRKTNSNPNSAKANGNRNAANGENDMNAGNRNGGVNVKVKTSFSKSRRNRAVSNLSAGRNYHNDITLPSTSNATSNSTAGRSLMKRWRARAAAAVSGNGDRELPGAATQQRYESGYAAATDDEGEGSTAMTRRRAARRSRSRRRASTDVSLRWASTAAQQQYGEQQKANGNASQAQTPQGSFDRQSGGSNGGNGSGSGSGKQRVRSWGVGTRFNRQKSWRGSNRQQHQQQKEQQEGTGETQGGKTSNGAGNVKVRVVERLKSLRANSTNNNQNHATSPVAASPSAGNIGHHHQHKQKQMGRRKSQRMYNGDAATDTEVDQAHANGNANGFVTEDDDEQSDVDGVRKSSSMNKRQMLLKGRKKRSSNANTANTANSDCESDSPAAGSSRKKGRTRNNKSRRERWRLGWNSNNNSNNNNNIDSNDINNMNNNNNNDANNQAQMSVSGTSTPVYSGRTPPSTSMPVVDDDGESLHISRMLGEHGRADEMDMRLWELDERGKSLALALLGNRSLARRKVGDTTGALDDACRCLRLDDSWIRGYVRKAAALREDGRITEAEKVARQGLKKDCLHAGLIDLIKAMAAEKQVAQQADEVQRQHDRDQMKEVEVKA